MPPTHRAFVALGMIGPPLLSLFLAAPAPAQECCPTVLTLDHLAQLSWPELECLYRQADAGRLPCGYYQGRAVYCKGKLGSRMRTGVTRMLWKGKHFSCGAIVNQWAAGRWLDGAVYRDASWMDGNPSIMLDYRCTSFVWRNVRDEIREVAPGLYLGIMFEEKHGRRTIKAFFVLEARCPVRS
jgi:hypothetical protein